MAYVDIEGLTENQPVERPVTWLVRTAASVLTLRAFTPEHLNPSNYGHVNDDAPKPVEPTDVAAA